MLLAVPEYECYNLSVKHSFLWLTEEHMFRSKQGVPAADTEKYLPDLY